LVAGQLAFQAAGVGGVRVVNLVDFDGGNGSTPYAGLLRASDGNFYGTTYRGGANGLPAGYGTVFRLTPEGAFSTLASFNSANGERPRASLVQGPDGDLYGTTEFGGANSQGTLFRMTSAGMLTVVAPFGNPNGTRPAAKLLLGNDGAWYGTTQFGGPNNRGTIFRCPTNGPLNTIFAFNLTNGATPYAELAQGPDGFLYGTTVSGGAFGWGTLFKISTNGALTTLISFNGTNGSNPHGSLTLESDAQFYGTATYGGLGFDGTVLSGNGTVFRVDTNGNFQMIYRFVDSTDGLNPWSTLARGIGGNLYGTTILGGKEGWGTVFQVTTNGAFVSLASFDYNLYGITPYGSLLPGERGSLYGTTSGQGVGLEGTVFRLDPSGAEVQIAATMGAPSVISWNALPGATYQPQYSSGLTDTNWNALGGIVLATNGIMSVTDASLSSTQRFYRVILFPLP
jgi:uncharacterized repeat protein (TIGR03803 family)